MFCNKPCGWYCGEAANREEGRGHDAPAERRIKHFGDSFSLLPVTSPGFFMSTPSKVVAKRLEQLSRLISPSVITSTPAISISLIASSVASSWARFQVLGAYPPKCGLVHSGHDVG